MLKSCLCINFLEKFPFHVCLKCTLENKSWISLSMSYTDPSRMQKCLHRLGLPIWNNFFENVLKVQAPQRLELVVGKIKLNSFSNILAKLTKKCRGATLNGEIKTWLIYQKKTKYQSCIIRTYKVLSFEVFFTFL